jgi:hypothetical protein
MKFPRMKNYHRYYGLMIGMEKQNPIAEDVYPSMFET